MNVKIIILISVILLILVFLASRIFLESGSMDFIEKETVSSGLIPINSITHGHGLAVDVDDPNKLYIATHHGLLVLINENNLYRIGNRSDDYMGFSPHPEESNIFFASGHPVAGGNLGFQRSEDGGFTWRKVSNGVRGPVDFHAMAISDNNPNLIYGWYQGALQTTTDGGENWEVVNNTDFVVVALAVSPSDDNILYAASPQGLFVSRNKGISFENLLNGFVSAIAINPSNTLEILLFSENQGLAKSNDGGLSWQVIDEDFSGEVPLYFSFNKKNTKIVYLLTDKNSIYKSIDGANTWSRIY